MLAGSYEVENLLGAGWEGEVYRVRERHTGIERTAKFFYPERNVKNKTLLFYARKLHRLQHCPMVIQCHAQDELVFRRHVISFLISEFVEGVLLSDFLRQQPGKRLQLFAAIHLLHALASRLECIHATGGYHGDLHTENIIVQRFGLLFELKLLELYHWGSPSKASIFDDVCDMIRIFYDALGGARTYAGLPDDIKKHYLRIEKNVDQKEISDRGRAQALSGNNGIQVRLNRMSEAIIYYGIDQLEPQAHTFRLGTICVTSAKARNNDSSNEDSVAIIPVNDKQIVAVVADGVGGHAQGNAASRIAVETISNELLTASVADNDLNTGIISSMDKANRQSSELGTGAATTLVLVETTPRHIRTYHAGDSVAMLVGQHGKLKMQTIAHSPVGYAVEAGLLDDQEAMQADNRHIVSNIAGYDDMRIEVGAPMTTAPRDTLLLASDGITDNLLIDAIIDHIRKGPIETAASPHFSPGGLAF